MATNIVYSLILVITGIFAICLGIKLITSLEIVKFFFVNF